eukprot:TRINITY_DN5491_c0_g1_i1.p1 TRINITY_DN5491_c0_g1~~TRINITY_DN5491_c0_g1_i1.p1  ORF type:complete len:288 (-),score=68.41 TRINITY_DN5491_c0_g1_i1:102-965(-)
MAANNAPIPQLLELMCEMGFDRAHSEKALMASGNTDVASAIEWYSNNAPSESPAGDASTTDAEMAEAEAFSSVADGEPKQELSPEELRQKRKEMEAKMKEATRKRIEKEARDDIERERKRREAGKSDSTLREEVMETQMEKDIAARKKEKKAGSDHMKMLRDRIKEDRDKRRQNKGWLGAGKEGEAAAPEAPAPAPAAAAPAAPAKDYDSCLLQIRLPDGNAIKAKFSPNDTLNTVYSHVADTLGMGDTGFGIMVPPRKVMRGEEELSLTTLKDANLVPRGAVTIIR